MNTTKEYKSNFLSKIIEDYINENPGKSIVTRFPPEPNGYLHIGHAKAITVSYGFAERYNGTYHLRFDDTNPTKEDQEYVDSIMEDVKWLGYDWGENLHFASDYFDFMHQKAIELIKQGKAFVCELNAEEMREYRGTLTEPGKNSPYRDRSIEENLDLFERMTKGEFEEGSKVLRAKIDMTSPNMNMRDPVIYRIQKANHHRTGDKWCVYPMYDWAHGWEDSLEGITHSLCSLEFEDHRPLYNWFLDQFPNEHHPRQIEFARLSVSYLMTSKRKLKKLIDENIVDGWDDPRLATISGMRRRGYSPCAIKEFCEEVGLAKSNGTVDFAFLEHFIRQDLQTSDEVEVRMAVIDPLKVVITNYPEDQVEWFDAKNHPKKEEMGKRQMPFSKVVYIEREDFMEEPVKGFKRLTLGGEVRLQHAYHIICNEVVKDENGEIIQLNCEYVPDTRGGWVPHRKVQGTIHWVSESHGLNTELRLYDKLFVTEDPEAGEEEGKTFLDNVNPDSLVINKKAILEPSFKEARVGERFQFMRTGYFIVDKDTKEGNLVFNKICSLKDGFKIK